MLELCRRISLTGLVLIIPPDHEAMRLLAAELITIVFLCGLCLVHPYKRADNNTLAIIAHTALLCVLLFASYIKMHHDIAELSGAASAADVLGFDDAFAFSLCLLCLTCTLLVTAFVLIGIQAVAFVSQRKLQVVRGACELLSLRTGWLCD